MQEMRQIDSCRTLSELFRMALGNFGAFSVMKIFDNLFSMQDFLNAKAVLLFVTMWERARAFVAAI